MYMIAEKKKENNLILSEVIEKNLRSCASMFKGSFDVIFLGFVSKNGRIFKIRRFEKRFLRF